MTRRSIRERIYWYCCGSHDRALIMVTIYFGSEEGGRFMLKGQIPTNYKNLMNIMFTCLLIELKKIKLSSGWHY